VDHQSKEDQLKEFALEFRSQSEVASKDRDASFDDAIQKKVLELYGEKESEAIFHSHHPSNKITMSFISSIPKPPPGGCCGWGEGSLLKN
jgi:hypothetical protein